MKTRKPYHEPSNRMSEDDILASELQLRSYIRRSAAEHDDPLLTVDIMRAVMQERKRPSLLQNLSKATPALGIIVLVFTIGFLSGYVSAAIPNVSTTISSIPWASLTHSSLLWVALGAAIFGVGIWQMER